MLSLEISKWSTKRLSPHSDVISLAKANHAVLQSIASHHMQHVKLTKLNLFFTFMHLSKMKQFEGFIVEGISEGNNYTH
jgi:hypothetical protein